MNIFNEEYLFSAQSSVATATVISWLEAGSQAVATLALGSHLVRWPSLPFIGIAKYADKCNSGITAKIQ